MKGLEYDQYIHPPTQGLDFNFQDMGWGPQWTHLSKLGQCQLGYNMSQAWAKAGLQRPVFSGR